MLREYSGQILDFLQYKTFLTVCAMLPHLSESERKETANMLESLSARSGSGPAPLVVQDTGVIIPAVNFLNIPICRWVLPFAL